MSVRMFVRSQMLKTTCANFMKFSVHVTCFCPPLMTLLYTFGFMDDVTSTHNGPYGMWLTGVSDSPGGRTRATCDVYNCNVYYSVQLQFTIS